MVKPRISQSKKVFLSLAVVLAAGYCGTSTRADSTETVWQDNGTDWSVAGNWSAGVPTSGISAEFATNTTYTNQPTLSVASTSQGIWVTNGSDLGPGGVTTTITGGNSLTVTGNATLDSLAGSAFLLDGAENNNLTIDNTVTQVTIGGTTNIRVNNAGTLTIAAPLNINGKTVTIDGTGTGSVIVSGKLTGAGTVTFNGTGNLTLANGSNDFSGTFNVGASDSTAPGYSTLTIGSDNAFGTSAVNIFSGGNTWPTPYVVLQASTDVSLNNTIVLGNGSGPGQAQRKLVAFGGSHNITLTGTVSTNTGALILNDMINGAVLTLPTVALTTGAYNAPSFSGAGAFVVTALTGGGSPTQAGANTVTYNGTSSLTFNGTSTYGTTTSMANGTVILDYTSVTSNVLYGGGAINPGALAFSGGGLELLGHAGAANTQVGGSLTLQGGGSPISLVAAGAGNTVQLNVGNVVRSNGATVNFSLPAGTSILSTVSNITNAGMIGGYATVGGSDWVAVGAPLAPTITGISTPATAPGAAYTFTVTGGQTDPTAGQAVSMNTVPTSATGIAVGQLYYVYNVDTVNHTFQLVPYVGSTAVLTNTSATVTNPVSTNATLNYQGSLTALASYDPFTDTATTNTKNYILTATPAALLNNQRTNSLKIANTSAGNLDLGGKSLSLNSDGLLFTGSADWEIKNGNLGAVGASNGDLIVQDYGTGVLTISATVTNPSGTNGFTKAGTGLLVLSGANTFKGSVNITGGVLRADIGTGIPAGQLIVLSNGVLETSTDITAALGTAAGNIELPSGASGFSAFGGPVNISIGGAGTETPLVWGAHSINTFNPTTLILNAGSADSALNFKNPIDLDGGTRVITVNSTNPNAPATISGVLSDLTGAQLVKAGPGVLNLSATNTYSSPTLVSAGTLALTGTGSISGSSAGITVNGTGARFLNNSSVAVTAPITITNGTIGGSGTISAVGGVTIGANATVSPGNSPAVQNYTTGMTFASGGRYKFEINNANGAAGANYDQLNISGGTPEGLDITATGGTFTIDLTSLQADNTPGDAANFNDTSSYAWLVATTTGLTSYDPADFTLSTANFSNDLGGGSFAVHLGTDIVPGVTLDGSGADLYVTFSPGSTPVPEPASLALLGLGAVALLRRRSRRA